MAKARSMSAVADWGRSAILRPVAGANISTVPAPPATARSSNGFTRSAGSAESRAGRGAVGIGGPLVGSRETEASGLTEQWC
ncbi:Uncharacterised protein [Mycobacteroides abscessus subsp. abscessus]|nr:Uncharacterised protein [Mycobacteroides abscessus subsp. abscessus]